MWHNASSSVCAIGFAVRMTRRAAAELNIYQNYLSRARPYIDVKWINTFSRANAREIQFIPSRFITRSSWYCHNNPVWCYNTTRFANSHERVSRGKKSTETRHKFQYVNYIQWRFSLKHNIVYDWNTKKKHNYYHRVKYVLRFQSSVWSWSTVVCKRLYEGAGVVSTALSITDSHL